MQRWGSLTMTLWLINVESRITCIANLHAHLRPAHCEAGHVQPVRQYVAELNASSEAAVLDLLHCCLHWQVAHVTTIVTSICYECLSTQLLCLGDILA